MEWSNVVRLSLTLFVMVTLLWFGWAVVRYPAWLDEPGRHATWLQRVAFGFKLCSVFGSSAVLCGVFVQSFLEGFWPEVVDSLSAVFGAASWGLVLHLYKHRWAVNRRAHLSRLHHELLEVIRKGHEISEKNLVCLKEKLESGEQDEDLFYADHLRDLRDLSNWAPKEK